MRCLATLFGIVLIAANASAAPLFEADRGGRFPVCGSVLDRLEKYAALYRDAPDVPIGTGGAVAIVGDWNWETGWVSSTTDSEVTAQFARYDIDNDGQEELIFYRSWMLRSQSNTALFIFKSDSKQPIDTSRVNIDDVEQMPRIASDPASSPYRSYGLQNLSIAPLGYNGTNYVVMMDGLFGHRNHPDRRLVVAKYTGVPIDKAKQNPTDKLNIVCSFKPRT